MTTDNNESKTILVKMLLASPFILTALAIPIWMYWQFHVVFGFLRLCAVALFLVVVLGVTTFLSNPRRVKGDEIVYNPTELPLVLGWIVGLLALFYVYMQVHSSVDLTTIQYGFGVVHLIGWGLMLNALLLKLIQNRNNQITLTPSGIEILKNDDKPIQFQWTDVLSVQKNSQSSTIVLTKQDESTCVIALGDFNMVDDTAFYKDLTALLGEEKIVVADTEQTSEQ